MTVNDFRAHVIPLAFSILPAEMASPEAVAMLLAIGYQESKFAVRVQAGGGPARGYWQFERGGVSAVMGPQVTREALQDAAKALAYPLPLTPWGCYDAIAHNDVLACVCARLLLWNVPEALPSKDDSARGWLQYSRAWRPGKPRPETWQDAWAKAWEA